MTIKAPFCPHYGTGQVLTAGASPLAAALDKDDMQVCITNLGANVAYVRELATGNASTADMPIPPGAMVIITKGIDIADIRLSYISTAGTTLHVITGNGW